MLGQVNDILDWLLNTVESVDPLLRTVLAGIGIMLETSILVGEQTAMDIGPAFKLREVGVLPVRGRAKSIRVFEVLRAIPTRDS